MENSASYDQGRLPKKFHSIEVGLQRFLDIGMVSRKGLWRMLEYIGTCSVTQP